MNIHLLERTHLFGALVFHAYATYTHVHTHAHTHTFIHSLQCTQDQLPLLQGSSRVLPSQQQDNCLEDCDGPPAAAQVCVCVFVLVYVVVCVLCA